MTEKYDVAIIGGGIVGSSIAAHLANENIKVVLINTDKLGIPASCAAAGLLTPFQHSEFENPLIKELLSNSLKYFIYFHDLIKEKNIDLGLSQHGSLYLLSTGAELARKENEFRESSFGSSEVLFLNKRELLFKEPLITPEVVGAYFYPNEGGINNPKFLQAVKRYCAFKNVDIINSEVKEIEFNKTKIKKVFLSNGRDIEANSYVLSNGVWANKILNAVFNLNINLIKAIKGELIEIEVNNENEIPKSNIFSKDGYIIPRRATNSFETSSIIVGSTSDEINLEGENCPFRNTTKGIHSLIELFNKLFPKITESYLSDSWSGLRPCTIDSMPILGKPENFENLFLSLGHYRNGILMGPYTGKIVADLILSGKPNINIDLFKFERFLKNKINSIN